jgi:hypothetical protein
MRRLFAPVLPPLFLFAACAAPPPALLAAPPELAAPAPPPQAMPARAHQVQVLLGGQSLDEDDWAPVDELFALGVTYSYDHPDDVVGFEVGLQGAFDSEDVLGVDISVGVSELYFGVHKAFFGDSRVQPYLGAGLTLVAVSTEGTNGFVSVSDDDACGAFYGHGGVKFLLTEGFALGLDLRFVGGTDVTLFGYETDVDYGQFGIFGEFRF